MNARKKLKETFLVPLLNNLELAEWKVSELRHIHRLALECAAKGRRWKKIGVVTLQPGRYYILRQVSRLPAQPPGIDHPILSEWTEGGWRHHHGRLWPTTASVKYCWVEAWV